MQYKSLSVICLVFCFFSFQSKAATPSDIIANQNRTYVNYQEIGEILSRQLPPLTERELFLQNQALNDLKAGKNQKGRSFDIPIPHKSQSYRNIALLMNTVYAYRYDTGIEVSMLEVLSDLEFFRNNDGSAEKTLFNTINRTKTIFGEIVLASMLANPLTSKEQLEKQRLFLEALSSSDQLMKKIDKRFKAIRKSQDSILKFFANHREFITDLVDRFNIWKNSKINSSINLASDARIFLSIAAELVNLWADYDLLKRAKNKSSSFNSDKITQDLHILKKVFTHSTAITGVVFFSWMDIASGQRRRDFIRLIHQLMIDVHLLFENIKELQNDLKDLPFASEMIKNFGLVEKITSNNEKTASSIKQLLLTLNSHPKRYAKSDKARYWLIDAGAIASAFKGLTDVLDDFGEIFEAIGEIDAYFAIASLVKEKTSNDSRLAKFSFAKFLDEPAPKVHLKDFWNPMIPREKVITNDLFLDENFHGMVLTGSNTAGKSTLIKSVVNAIVMGQGMGVTCSSSAELTPFHTIYSSMNISDNIAKGESLFQSEINRAKRVAKLARSVSEEKKGFFLVDELFTGTSAEKGEQAATQFAQNLFQKKGNLTLFVTHFKKVTSVAADESVKGVKNYKIEAIKHSDGSISRPFKLEEGISEVNIADELLNQAIGDGLFD